MLPDRPHAQPVMPARPPAYTPPRLQALGPWQAVTLIQSVPINPGSVFNPLPEAPK